MDAQAGKLDHFGNNLIDILNQQAFSHFQRQMGGIGASGGKCPFYAGNKFCVMEVPGTDVD